MRKILVVEDDPNVASLLREVLLEEGFITVQAQDVDSAWAVLKAEDPDAAILDIMLYGQDEGWKFLDRTRADDHYKELPVVVLTGMNGAETVERATAAGAEFLAKPFTPAAIVDRLRRAMLAAGRSPGIRGLPTVILTPTLRIEGELFVAVDLPRFSDAWEALVKDPRSYIPLTNARIYTHEGDVPIAKNSLLSVRKSEITAVFPLEDA